MRLLWAVAAGSVALLSTAPAMAETFAAKCEYWADTPKGDYEKAPCLVSYGQDKTGRFETTVTMDKRVFRIVELNRQSTWATVTINGRPGMRYELNRQAFDFSTMDLKLGLMVSTN
jgi:hypothetical protein